MDTLPLPPRPNLDQYKKRAKSLVAAAQSNDPNAVRRLGHRVDRITRRAARRRRPTFVRHSIDRAVTHLAERVAAKRSARRRLHARRRAVSDCRSARLRELGRVRAPRWRRLSGSDPRDAEFERAADAVVSGDLAMLAALVRANPQLIREHSRRVHRATLLHYVAANGVEDFRQKTPKNAVEIARFLLDAGAVPDALADTYGADTLQTTMNLLVSSAHPADAGLQSRDRRGAARLRCGGEWRGRRRITAHDGAAVRIHRSG